MLVHINSAYLAKDFYSDGEYGFTLYQFHFFSPFSLL